VYFHIPVKTGVETLRRGDLFYEKRRLLRVVSVGKVKGKEHRFTVKFALLAKINLDTYLRSDRTIL